MGEEDLTEVMNKTKDMWKGLIKKPNFSDKLLGKPPFRFLLDVTKNYVKEQGVFKGLFADDEYETALASKESKIEFLTKLINAVSGTLGKPLDVRANKVVAGMEPERTNELLQGMAKIVKDGKDWESGMKRASANGASSSGSSSKKKEKKSDGKEGKDSKDSKDKDREEKKHSSKDEKKKEHRSRDDEKKHKDGEREEKKKHRESDEKKDRKEKDSKDSKDKKDSKSPAVPALPLKQEEEKAKEKEKDEKKEERKPGQPVAVERPSTARPAPPKVASNAQQVETTAVTTKDASGAGNVISDSKGKKGSSNLDSDSEDDTNPILDPTAETEQSEETSGQGYLSNMNAKDPKPVVGPTGVTSMPDEGGTGIVLNQRKSKAHQKESLDVEIKRLRESLQTLTKSTNPLGKAMEFVAEDLDAMQRELEVWRSEAQAQNNLWKEQQKVTEDMLAPLIATQQDLEDSINDQILKTASVKASILRSDAHIENLLRMVVNSGGNKR